MGPEHAGVKGRGRNPREVAPVHQAGTAEKDPFDSDSKGLMEEVVGRENMYAAWKRVKSNGGASGVDGMNVGELMPWLMKHWSRVKVELLEDRYNPAPVRKVEIPKAGGKGVRQLGIPTVLDRLIQQALHQVLTPLFDPGFSERSYGFRPGRSTHDAVKQARNDVCEGRRWVVDLDLEKFFDRVNHDVLMNRVARRVSDKRVLRLIRRYLRAGVLEGGIAPPKDRGTPQGGPLSPLLSNILLDDLDKELERRGHAFCRYADDCNIFVSSRRGGERVLASVGRFLEDRLSLKVNQQKSAVDRPWKRKFLGYSMTGTMKPRLKVAPESVKRLKGNLKEVFRRGRGRNLRRLIREDLMPILRGWGNYFSLSEVKVAFLDLDAWLRRKLRCIVWRQWKRPRTRYRKMRELGLAEDLAKKGASNGRGPWWNAGTSHMNRAFPIRTFTQMGLVSLVSFVKRV